MMKNKIIFSLIVFIALISVASAFDWPFGKASYCTFMNVTGTDCEVLWCNNVLNNATQNCAYKTADDTCICTIIQNVTINSTNATLISANLTDFYNKTQIDALLNLSSDSALLNQTEDMITNATDELEKNLTAKMIAIKNSILDTQENRTLELINANLHQTDYTARDTTDWTMVWIILIIAVVIVVCFLSWGAMHKTKDSKEWSVMDATRKPYKKLPKHGTKFKDKDIQDALEGKPISNKEPSVEENFNDELQPSEAEE